MSFDVMLKMFYEEDQLERRGKDSSSNDEDRPLGALDLFDDPSMEEFFSRGVRGGQSFIATREAEGNDNPETAGDHLLYVDGKIDKKSFCLIQKYGKNKKIDEDSFFSKQFIRKYGNIQITRQQF